MYQTLKLAAAAMALATSLTVAPTFASESVSRDGQIELTYVWTAHPGQEDRLVATYAQVGQVLYNHEPGLLRYEISVSETGDQIVIREVFEDGDALAFHLSETAGQFFPEIVQFATPGPFIFRGDVPEELKAAAYSMNMGAIFTSDWSGFERD